jgi:hypothetical protein
MELAEQGPDLAVAVLHSLRLKGRATEVALAGAVGAPVEDVSAMLERARADELCARRTGRLAGWTLTPAGQRHWAEHHALERAGLDLAPLDASYHKDFLALNRQFKEVCTRWQLASDRDVTTADLAHVHQAAGDLLTEYAAVVPRLAGYRKRLGAALARFLGGEATALVQPLSDSYHDIWLELHEDLLVLLDKRREADD